MDRKEFFQSGIRDIASNFSQTSLGKLIDQRLQALANLLAPQGLEYFKPLTVNNTIEQKDLTHKTKYFPRPPGALAIAEDFEQACTVCQECQRACPYQAIQCEENSGPFLDPNTTACQLCEDFPCISSCPEDALLPIDKGYLPKLGQAELIKEHCINWESNGDCRKCAENCPVSTAIDFSQDLPEFTASCTGCGICRSSCPALPVAIHIYTAP